MKQISTLTKNFFAILIIALSVSQTANATFTLSLNKVYIQSYYIGGGLMAPAAYDCGSGSSPTDVELITVKLLSATNPCNVVASGMAMLSTSGICNITFSGVPDGSYTISVCGCNALSVSSANPIAFTNTGSPTISYDFSLAASQALGSNMVDLGGGIYALYSGDFNQDCKIDSIDRAILDSIHIYLICNVPLSCTCICFDLNYDGYIDAGDVTTLDNLILSFSGSLAAPVCCCSIDPIVNSNDTCKSWLLGGNFVGDCEQTIFTDYTNNMLGIMDQPSSIPLRIYTNNNEKMTILGNSANPFDDGNVGIGVFNPSQKLHVHNGSIFITGAGKNGNPMLLFGDNTPTSSTPTFVHPEGNWGIEYVPTGLNFWRPFLSAGGFANDLLFLDNNGNIGIGTSTPQATLDVRGGKTSNTTTTDGTVKIENLSTGTPAMLVTADSNPNHLLQSISFPNNANQYLNGTGSWTTPAGGGAGNEWLITGNANVNSGNFLGTLVNANLNFVVNNRRAGTLTEAGFTSLGTDAGGIGLANGTGFPTTTAIGFQALMNVNASGNTATGFQAMRSHINGNDNCAYGLASLVSDFIGNNNSAYGYYSLLNSNSNGNSAFGSLAGTANTTGTNNTAIGFQSDFQSNNLTNATAIGFNSIVGASNSLILGATAPNQVRVGIGTAIPLDRLHVAGSDSVNAIIRTDRLAHLISQAPLVANDALVVTSHLGQLIRKIVFPNTANQFLNGNGQFTTPGGGINGCATPAINFLTKWTSTSLQTICNSIVFDNGINVGIGTTLPGYKLHIIANTINGSNTNNGGVYSRVTTDIKGLGNSKYAIRGDIIPFSSIPPGSTANMFHYAGYFKARTNRPNDCGGIQKCKPGTTWAGYFVGDVNVTGRAYNNHGFWSTSDSTLKQNINNISNALSTINQLHPKSFDYRLNDFPYLNLPTENQFGFIAQDVNTILPNLVDSVHYAEETDSSDNVVYPGGNFLSLNYTSIIPIAIKGIQELDSIVSNLSSSSVSTSCTLQNNYLPKATGAGALCNSKIYDNGIGVAIGTNVIPAGYGFIVDSLKAGFRELYVVCQDSVWPDYVFESTYPLKPLHELENYVTTNKHLPGIPSALEIKNGGGINIGEMQAKQMEKIEELYKYIIEMNKNMGKLSDENKALKERMTILDKK